MERSNMLVIADDSSVLETLETQLVSAGYKVTLAHDGEEGLTLTRELRPDVVICDRLLPIMDGVEYCRTVKSDPHLKTTYVAILTGFAETQDKVIALDAGADEFLVKPVHQEELLARVRAGLRTRSVQRELADARHRTALMEMAATLGHEINNPLTALFGHLELMLHHLQAGDRDQMQHHIRESTQVAGRIAEVAQRLTAVRSPQTTVYIDEMRMLDLHKV